MTQRGLCVMKLAKIELTRFTARIKFSLVRALTDGMLFEGALFRVCREGNLASREEK